MCFEFCVGGDFSCVFLNFEELGLFLIFFKVPICYVQLSMNKFSLSIEKKSTKFQ